MVPALVGIYSRLRPASNTRSVRLATAMSVEGTVRSSSRSSVNRVAVKRVAPRRARTLFLERCRNRHHYRCDGHRIVPRKMFDNRRVEGTMVTLAWARGKQEFVDLVDCNFGQR